MEHIPLLKGLRDLSIIRCVEGGHLEGFQSLEVCFDFQIQDVIKLKQSAYWVELFGSNNIPCSISIENYEISFFQDEQAFQNNMIYKSLLDDGSEYAFSHNLIQFPELPIPVIKPTPMLGEHSIEILRDFGIEESLIDAIVKSGSLITP